jgi:hypothetical protein
MEGSSAQKRTNSAHRQPLRSVPPVAQFQNNYPDVFIGIKNPWNVITLEHPNIKLSAKIQIFNHYAFLTFLNNAFTKHFPKTDHRQFNPAPRRAWNR